MRRVDLSWGERKRLEGILEMMRDSRLEAQRRMQGPTRPSDSN